MIPQQEAREALAAHLHKLIGEYWTYAYREGQENRVADTPESHAGKCLSEIQHTIRLLIDQHPPASTAEVDRLRDRVERLRGLCKSAVGHLHDAGADAEADAIHDLIGDMEPASMVSAEPCSPEMEREVDESLGIRLLQVRVPEEWANALRTEADRREVPLTVVLRERLKPASAGADAVETACRVYWQAVGGDEWPAEHDAFCPGLADDIRAAMCAALDAAYPALTREVAELRARADELEHQRDQYMSIASQINTDWIPANRKLSEKLAASEAALREARETLARFAKRIRRDYRPDYGGDHACARCYPHSDMLVPGFVCVVHQAIDLDDAARAATKEASSG